MPIGELATDLRTGNVPRFSYVVPDECHDMYGDPPYCLDSGNIRDPQNQHLVAVGDAYLGHLVSKITHASFWAQGNNAIVVTYDNGDNAAGCCDANPGGGRVATIVITSHGPRRLRDAQPANHYSLLSTLQHIFGVGCLQYTCDTAHVHPIYSLFTDTGSTPIATKVLPERNWPTPTPSQPAERRSMTTSTKSSGGWTVQRTQRLGTSDNSLGAVAGSSPTDVWAVGDYLPSAKDSNQDATLTFAEHLHHRHPALDPRGDLLVAGLQLRPALAVPVRAHRPHHRHDLPDQLIGELLFTSPAGQAGRHRRRHVTLGCLAVHAGLRGHARSLFPASQARSTSRISITDTSRNTIPATSSRSTGKIRPG